MSFLCPNMAGISMNITTNTVQIRVFPSHAPLLCGAGLPEQSGVIQPEPGGTAAHPDPQHQQPQVRPQLYTSGPICPGAQHYESHEIIQSTAL